jgi:hypothetical protein
MGVEHGLPSYGYRVFENDMLSKMFGHEVRGGRTDRRDEEIYDLGCSLV